MPIVIRAPECLLRQRRSPPSRESRALAMRLVDRSHPTDKRQPASSWANSRVIVIQLHLRTLAKCKAYRSRKEDEGERWQFTLSPTRSDQWHDHIRARRIAQWCVRYNPNSREGAETAISTLLLQQTFANRRLWNNLSPD